MTAMRTQVAVRIAVAGDQVQEQGLRRIRVKLVPTSDFRETDRCEVARRVRERLGGTVEVVVDSGRMFALILRDYF